MVAAILATSDPKGKEDALSEKVSQPKHPERDASDWLRVRAECHFITVELGVDVTQRFGGTVGPHLQVMAHRVDG
jgi:hypothetical protein